jgi:SH3-like domain-containing protein
MRLSLLVVPTVCAGLAAVAPAAAQSSLGSTAPSLPPPQATTASPPPPAPGGTASGPPPRAAAAPTPRPKPSTAPRPANPTGSQAVAPRPAATPATSVRPATPAPPSATTAPRPRPPAAAGTGAPAAARPAPGTASRTSSRAAAGAGAAAGAAALGAAASRPPDSAVPPEPPPPRLGSATGMPLPRYAALGSNQVNLRIGPDLRYPIEWTYQRKDLPVQIIEEHQHWRRIRDPEGTEGWVQRPLLTSRRSFLVQGEERVLRRRAEEDASPVARLKPGVIGRIRRCEDKQAWCEVQVGDYRGWLKRSEIWGVAPDEAVN